jgi:hypothetical protein
VRRLELELHEERRESETLSPRAAAASPVGHSRREP